MNVATEYLHLNKGRRNCEICWHIVTSFLAQLVLEGKDVNDVNKYQTCLAFTKWLMIGINESIIIKWTESNGILVDNTPPLRGVVVQMHLCIFKI